MIGVLLDWTSERGVLQSYHFRACSQDETGAERHGSLAKGGMAKLCFQFFKAAIQRFTRMRISYEQDAVSPHPALRLLFLNFLLCYVLLRNCVFAVVARWFSPATGVLGASTDDAPLLFPSGTSRGAGHTFPFSQAVSFDPGPTRRPHMPQVGDRRAEPRRQQRLHVVSSVEELVGPVNQHPGQLLGGGGTEDSPLR